MIFQKNQKNQTYYQTPYGQMLIGVNTKNMEVDVAEDRINVSLDYELDVNHEPLADCRIRMGIMNKGTFPETGLPVDPGNSLYPRQKIIYPFGNALYTYRNCANGRVCRGINLICRWN